MRLLPIIAAATLTLLTSAAYAQNMDNSGMMERSGHSMAMSKKAMMHQKMMHRKMMMRQKAMMHRQRMMNGTM